MTLAYVALVFLTISAAIAVVTTRNVVHAAVCLGASFLGVAGFYLLLNAPFLAVGQILIYVGAVIVLMLFAIFLTAQRLMREPRGGVWFKFVCGAVALALFAVLYSVTYGTPWKQAPTPADAPPVDRLPRLADTLLQIYLLPFEVASVLLLVALVGAVILAKEERTD